jgi:hypothetical protein
MGAITLLAFDSFIPGRPARPPSCIHDGFCALFLSIIRG